MGCVTMAADRATEARQAADACLTRADDAGRLSGYLSWALDERERLTEALRDTAVDLAITITQRHGIPGGCGAVRPNPCQACARDQLALDRIGAALSAVSERKPA